MCVCVVTSVVVTFGGEMENANLIIEEMHHKSSVHK